MSHFDLTPSGEEAWISDTLGGISHCDFREGGDRRRWVVQEPGRAAKLGGISVNRESAQSQLNISIVASSYLHGQQ